MKQFNPELQKKLNQAVARFGEECKRIQNEATKAAQSLNDLAKRLNRPNFVRGSRAAHRVAVVMKPAHGMLGSKPIEPCIGCEEAMQRIASGENCTLCHVCGCRWLSRRDAEKYKSRILKNETV